MYINYSDRRWERWRSIYRRAASMNADVRERIAAVSRYTQTLRDHRAAARALLLASKGRLNTLHEARGSARQT